MASSPSGSGSPLRRVIGRGETLVAVVAGRGKIIGKNGLISTRYLLNWSYKIEGV